MVKKRKKKQFSLLKGIVIFAIVSFFTWLFMNGLLEVIDLDTSPWIKVIAGIVGLIIIGLVGWKKF